MPFKQINTTLYNSKNIDLNYYKNKFIQENGYYEITDFNNWLKQYFKNKLNKFFEKLSLSNIRYENFVIIGKTEGNFKCSVISEDLFQSIKNCVENEDNILIEQKNGHIHIETANQFKGNFIYDIFMLNEKGMKFQTANLNKPCYHKSIRTKII